MKYSLTKYWRKHVNDAKWSLNVTNLKINGRPFEDKW
jgi:hypothetical protein